MNRFPAILVAFVISAFANTATRADSFRDAFGPRFRGDPSNSQRPIGPKKGLDTLHRWNEIAINASGLDHTPVAPGDTRIFGEQLGPGRSSRAMAIVHIAIFDSVNALERDYRSYTGVRLRHRDDDISLDAAIAQAAHDALVVLYPSQAASFDAALADDLAKIDNNKRKANGVDLGQRAAAAILAMRVGDGAEVHEPHLGVDYFTSTLAGHWRQDPISLIPLALGAHWGECVPFVLNSASQFRVPPPPSMTSHDYATAYNEVKRLGGDGNPQTIGDPNFSPLGAPASNLLTPSPNFTPPFPAYPSGHAGFGGALFQTLRRFYGTDRIPFTFVSDEFNGVTKDHNGNVRPYMPRSFSSLSQAEEENGQSRIYLGIHWSFDKTQGIAQGRRVGNYVFDHAFTPLHDR